MDPVDFRNATFASLQAKLAGQRAAVLQAWRMHGPGTTAEVCARAGLSILTFRPRTTELFQLGFLQLSDTPTNRQSAIANRKSHEGVYRVRTPDEQRTWFADHQIAARPGQRLLSFAAADRGE